MQPKVSIIVPCWGVEKYLDRCVESLVHQTLQDIEIILVDDESPDRVPEMCDEWARKDSRIKVVHKKNGGLGMACNSGMEVATGEYIAFCDSDDWVDHEMYQTMFEASKKYAADIVYSGIRRVDENGKHHSFAQTDKLYVYDTRDNINVFMLSMIANPPGIRSVCRTQKSAKIVLYKHSLISDNNIHFESERQYISEDLLFNLDNLSNAICVVELPYTFYNYFVNAASISQKVRTDRLEKNYTLLQHLLHRYDGLMLLEDYKTRVYRLFIDFERSDIGQICKSDSLTDSERNLLLRKIVNHSCWREIASIYPVRQMPFVHRVLFWALLYKQTCLIKLIFRLK